MKNKTPLIILAAIIGLFLIMFMCVMGSKNTAISLEETVNTAQSGIDVQQANRFNKLTELAECVKKYDEHEYKALVDVISARGKNMTATQAKECIAAFSRVEERYPDLKSQMNYKHLMTEISLTENHLAQHKKAFNEAIRDYRRHCRSFPSSMFLSMTGYEMIEFKYYEVDESIKDTKPMKLF
jgi:LemA protein